MRDSLDKRNEPMTHAIGGLYWASLLRQIREVQHWSQARIAEELDTNQETISRWEKAAVLPSPQKQAIIEQLAEGLFLSSLRGIASIVRCSPYPMLLCDREDVVIAASLASGFREGKDVLSQTPPEQHAYYRELSTRMEADGFWQQSGERSNYDFTNEQGRKFRAVMVSVGVRGQVYCLVQAVPDDGSAPPEIRDAGPTC